MRKAIFALLVMSCITASAHAQLIDKGVIMAGGSLEFTSLKGNEVFTVNPTLGYFLADNAALGVSLTYSSISKFDQFYIGPFARYYTNFGLFGHGGIQFTHIKDAEKENNFDFLLGLGYAAFLNDNVALEPLFTVNFLDGDTYTRLGISLQVYFGR